MMHCQSRYFQASRPTREFETFSRPQILSCIRLIHIFMNGTTSMSYIFPTTKLELHSFNLYIYERHHINELHFPDHKATKLELHSFNSYSYGAPHQ